MDGSRAKKDDEALISEAYECVVKGQHLKAVAVYTDLISRRRVSGLFHQRGLSYLVLGEFIDAIEDFTTAIELDRGDPDSYFNRGNVYLKLKSYESAINDFNVAISLAPDDPTILNSRGFALAKSGRRKDGMRDLNVAVSLDANYVSARFNLGILYFEAGELAESLIQLDSAASLSPDDDAIIELRREVEIALRKNT